MVSTVLRRGFVRKRSFGKGGFLMEQLDGDIDRSAKIIWDQNFMNCSDHCWCHCPDDMAVKLKVEAIVTAFRDIEHEHGQPIQCSGCLLEAGEIQIL